MKRLQYAYKPSGNSNYLYLSPPPNLSTSSICFFSSNLPLPHPLPPLLHFLSFLISNRHADIDSEEGGYNIGHNNNEEHNNNNINNNIQMARVAIPVLPKASSIMVSPSFVYFTIIFFYFILHVFITYLLYLF